MYLPERKIYYTCPLCLGRSFLQALTFIILHVEELCYLGQDLLSWLLFCINTSLKNISWLIINLNFPGSQLYFRLILSLAIKHPCEVCIVFVVNVCDSRIVRLLLFISINVQVAKWSGDLFNEGLYDIHIKLKRVPLLEWAIPQEMYRCVLKSYSSLFTGKSM